jgi:hypothetical protein
MRADVSQFVSQILIEKYPQINLGPQISNG